MALFGWGLPRFCTARLSSAYPEHEGYISSFIANVWLLAFYGEQHVRCLTLRATCVHLFLLCEPFYAQHEHPYEQRVLFCVPLAFALFTLRAPFSLCELLTGSFFFYSALSHFTSNLARAPLTLRAVLRAALRCRFSFSGTFRFVHH